ncbi:NAD(P)/FAD-dependent oxidoreductase [Actinacidiphila oryziradicis]|jgi:NADH dehydrogenase|uniref:NAD(P)/FAD-dependent oxidoreductase n=1 Tax=Actinacidiphila oryziradicis TaxID=2571141 RepID=UPI0023F35CA9|nr:NAD(P)/FAD-dependent oxidoreductase [Actinacidiphila oryziradicis]MCW2871693.1 dehydrogenase-like protein [Actinacidiphila oryziradicis]
MGATKESAEERTVPRILVVGGGYVGMYTALRLQQKLKLEPGGRSRAQSRVKSWAKPRSRAPEAEIVIVTAQPYMTYQPFLPEAAAGSISPRHVVVPLRRVLGRCRIVIGEAHRIDHSKRVATVSTLATEEEGSADIDIPYDQLVIAPGSVSRTLPIPGLAEHGIGFKTVEEAIGLRNHVLEQLDIASSTRDVEVRDAALTFVFVGGGYAGVEALGELEDMARYAARYYHNVTADDMKWVLVEAADRILPEVGDEMGRYAIHELRGRSIDIRLNTRLESCENRVAVLDDGSRFPTRTVVWTAGVRAHPMLDHTDLPRDDRGRVKGTATLRVEGTDNAWVAGDAGAVPDLTAGQERDAAGGVSGRVLLAPNAQHAVRQARVLADNIVATLRGEPVKEYRHKDAGSVASLGLHKGVAYLYGRRVKGYPAWFIHRAYHLSRMPTFNRKARVLAEWTLSGLFKREIVSLGSLEHPRAEFELAANDGRKPDAP